MMIVKTGKSPNQPRKSSLGSSREWQLVVQVFQESHAYVNTVGRLWVGWGTHVYPVVTAVAFLCQECPPLLWLYHWMLRNFSCTFWRIYLSAAVLSFTERRSEGGSIVTTCSAFERSSFSARAFAYWSRSMKLTSETCVPEKCSLMFHQILGHAK